MKRASFQGTALTSSQRARLAFQQSTRAGFLNSTLQEQVVDIESKLQERKEQGAKPEKQWYFEFESAGTPFVGEAFGF